MFTELKDCTVTLLLNGVYRVFPVADKDHKLYAKIGKTAYVKLSRGGSTSTKARWIYIIGIPDEYKVLEL